MSEPIRERRADRDRIVVLLTGDTDWEEIRELVTESYRILAPKTVRDGLGRWGRWGRGRGESIA